MKRTSKKEVLWDKASRRCASRALATFVEVVILYAGGMVTLHPWWDTALADEVANEYDPANYAQLLSLTIVCWLSAGAFAFSLMVSSINDKPGKNRLSVLLGRVAPAADALVIVVTILMVAALAVAGASSTNGQSALLAHAVPVLYPITAALFVPEILASIDRLVQAFVDLAGQTRAFTRGRRLESVLDSLEKDLDAHG